MNDRELLKLAAKAAGHKLGPEWDYAADGIFINGNGKWSGDPWNPLTDDGDALRLAVSRDIHIGPNPGKGKVIAYDGVHIAEIPYCEDKESATRRVITMVAAAIGEAMP